MSDTDLPRLISKLIANGYSEQEIADQLKADGIQVHQSTIHRIKHGEFLPRFDVGMGIIRLHDRAPRPPRSAP